MPDEAGRRHKKSDHVLLRKIYEMTNKLSYRPEAAEIQSLVAELSTEDVSEAEKSWEQIEQMVSAAVRERYDTTDAQGYPSHNVWVTATYGDRVVFSLQTDGKHYESSYEIGMDGTVILGGAVEVVPTYAAAASEAISETAQIVEAGDDGEGREWEVVLIKQGVSANGNLYTKEALEGGLALFEGVQAFVDHPARSEERDRPERSARDIVGWYDNVRYEENRVIARFHVSENAQWLRDMLRSAFEEGKKDLVGFSIRADVTARAARVGEAARRVVEKLIRVVSVDVVTVPAAGGEVLRLVASDRSGVKTNEEAEMPKEAKTDDKEKTPTVEDRISSIEEGMAGLSEMKEAITSLTETVKAQAETPSDEEETPTETNTEAAGDDGADQVNEKVQEALAEVAKLKEAAQRATYDQMLARKLAEAEDQGLPKLASAHLGKRLIESIQTEEQIDTAIKEERELFANLMGGGQIRGMGDITVGSTPRSKKVLALEGMFAREDMEDSDGKKVRRFQSLKEAYCEFHGISPFQLDVYEMLESFQGRYLSTRDHSRVREALDTSDWAEVFADVLYNRLIKVFATPSRYDDWRKIVSNVKSVPDFRTQHATRIGGFGDLPTVGELATYTDVDIGGDEEVTYAVSKRGYTTAISIEAIANDNIGSVSAIPRKLAEAAKRTLYLYVMNTLLADNPTMDYDSVALFHAASHVNLLTAALSVTAIDSVVQAMRSFTAFGESAKVLGQDNEPKYLLVPNELKARAERIINPSDAYAFALSSTPDADASLDPQQWKGAFEVITVDDWSDADNWVMVADPRKVETIELGFLNGREQPELLIQDDPKVGSVFSADKITYKIRHVYAGDVIEHRSFHLNQV